MVGNMKQLYIADPSEHKFLVNEGNRPGTLSNILESVFGMLLGFCRKQNNASHNTGETEEQAQATHEASTIDTISTSDNSSSGKTLKAGNEIDNVTENNAFLGIGHNTSDIVDFHTNVSAQNDTNSSDLSAIHTKLCSQHIMHIMKC